MSIPLVNIFQFTLFLLCILLSGFVASQRKPVALAALFFVLGLHPLFVALELYYGAKCFEHASALMLLYGPFLYLTVTSVLQRRYALLHREYYHLLPYLLTITLWGAGYFNKSLNVLLGAVSLTIYIAASFYRLRRFKNVMNHTRSTGLPDAFQWLSVAVQLFFYTAVFMTLRTLSNWWLADSVLSKVDFLFFIVASFWFAVLVFKGLGSTEFIPELDKEEDELTTHIAGNPVRAPNRNQLRLVKTINDYMNDKKPFVDAQITVKQFAEGITIPARQVSEVINDHYGMSFSEFINRARVNETKRLMLAAGWQDKSLLDIAMAAGFNSKSSFNLMFKRITGITPSEYRSKIQSGQNRNATDSGFITEPIANNS